jgi:hypothetical protein
VVARTGFAATKEEGRVMDDLDLDSIVMPDEWSEAWKPFSPTKFSKRRRHFIRVPFDWLERLGGAGGQVYALALHLLYLHWRAGGAQFKLPTKMLEFDGISRRTKWRALVELEGRGLISIERRRRKSPLVSLVPNPAHD